MDTRLAAALLCIMAVGGIPLAVAAQPPELPDPVAGCAACHLKEGIPALPGWPYLAGMEKMEIIERLKGHRAALIPDSTMDKVAAGLSDREIEQAADYYSNLEPSDPPPIRLRQ